LPSSPYFEFGLYYLWDFFDVAAETLLNAQRMPADFHGTINFLSSMEERQGMGQGKKDLLFLDTQSLGNTVVNVLNL